MVDAGEELAQVAGEDVAKAPSVGLAAIEGAVGAFADAVGVAGGDERPLEARFDDVAEGVMDYAVPEWRSGDETALGLVNVEAVIRPGAIGLGDQFFLEQMQIVL